MKISFTKYFIHFRDLTLVSSFRKYKFSSLFSTKKAEKFICLADVREEKPVWSVIWPMSLPKEEFFDFENVFWLQISMHRLFGIHFRQKKAGIFWIFVQILKTLLNPNPFSFNFFFNGKFFAFFFAFNIGSFISRIWMIFYHFFWHL